jgi:DNA (cytosine-5)-methyltransferase 1
MSCGLHQAGFHVVAASDAWHDAAITYLLNLGFPDTQVHVLELVPDKMNGKRAWQLHERLAGDTITAAELFKHHGTEAAPGDGWISSKRDHDPEECPQPTHLEEPESRRWWCETYHATDPLGLPCLRFYLGDVRQLTGARILDDLGLDLGELDLVAGGPPCQGFSHAGQRQVEDPRNSLVFEFARLVLEMRPRTMFMENVSGMVSMVTPEGIPVVDALCRVLEDGGFGAYDALRKSILTTAGVGAAVRSRKRRDDDVEDDRDEAPAEPAVEQLDIFGALETAA